MAKKTLLNKLEETILSVSIALAVTTPFSYADSFHSPVKETIGSYNVKGDENPEEFYLITPQIPPSQDGIDRKIVYEKELIMEEDKPTGTPSEKKTLLSFTTDPKSITLQHYPSEDGNKDEFIDIIYVIKNQEKNVPSEKKYEMYVLRGKEGGFFSAPEFVKYVNE